MKRRRLLNPAPLQMPILIGGGEEKVTLRITASTPTLARLWRSRPDPPQVRCWMPLRQGGAQPCRDRTVGGDSLATARSAYETVVPPGHPADLGIGGTT
jgi:hypothetical protein